MKNNINDVCILVLKYVSDNNFFGLIELSNKGKHYSTGHGLLYTMMK